MRPTKMRPCVEITVEDFQVSPYGWSNLIPKFIILLINTGCLQAGNKIKTNIINGGGGGGERMGP